MRWLLASVVLMACDAAGSDREVERARLNAECAAIRDEMREELESFDQRARDAAEDPDLRAAVDRELAAPIRSPDPCFGHGSLAADVPSQLATELDARFASLSAAFTNHGERDRYVALQPERAEASLREHIERIRTLASTYAATE